MQDAVIGAEFLCTQQKCKSRIWKFPINLKVDDDRENWKEKPQKWMEFGFLNTLFTSNATKGMSENNGRDGKSHA